MQKGDVSKCQWFHCYMHKLSRVMLGALLPMNVKCIYKIYWMLKKFFLLILSRTFHLMRLSSFQLNVLIILNIDFDLSLTKNLSRSLCIHLAPLINRSL